MQLVNTHAFPLVYGIQLGAHECVLDTHQPDESQIIAMCGPAGDPASAAYAERIKLCLEACDGVPNDMLNSVLHVLNAHDIMATMLHSAAPYVRNAAEAGDSAALVMFNAIRSTLDRVGMGPIN